MTRSNRTLNRVLLALTGLLALAVGLALVAPALAGVAALRDPVTAVREAVRGAGVALAEPSTAALAGGAGLLVAVLAIVWIATRGRGGTAIADADADADVEITIGAVRDVLAAGLRPVPAVIAVRADAHRLRGRTVVTVTLSTRRRADLTQILARTREALVALDRAMGVNLPVVVRIRSGWRSTLARDQRAE
jgi:hypothetical protein